jgi:hypothetical protein
MWWHKLRKIDRCRIFVDSNMPEFQVLGFHLSGYELHELPASARSVVEEAWRNELTMHAGPLSLVPRHKDFPI